MNIDGEFVMSWNHRVVVKENHYGIHEVYYDAEGYPDGVTKNPVYPIGESLEALHSAMEMYQVALEKAVLNYNDFLAMEHNDAPAQ